MPWPKKKLGTTLAPSIKSLYQETDGVRLLWFDNRDDNFDLHRNPRRKKVSQVFYQESQCASIFIPSIKNLFRIGYDGNEDFNNDGHWDWLAEETETFMEQEYDGLAYAEKVRLFDGWHDYAMGFFINGESNPPVFFHDDHGKPSNVTTNFEYYLKFLLATKGICSYRRGVFARSDNTAIVHRLTDDTFWDETQTIDLDSYFSHQNELNELKKALEKEPSEQKDIERSLKTCKAADKVLSRLTGNFDLWDAKDAINELDSDYYANYAQLLVP